MAQCLDLVQQGILISLMADDFLRSLSNGAGYDVYSAIRELLDNSLGANATKIEISIKDGKFKISDNGEGMTEKILSKNFFCAGNSSTKKPKRCSW